MYVPVSYTTSSQTWSASVQLPFTGVAKISTGSLISRLFSIEKMRCKFGTFMDCRSLRSSRFLSFSKRSRTRGKLRKSGKISSRGRGWGDDPHPPPSYSPPPYFSPIFWLTPGVLLRSPAFRSLVRISARPEKGKESAATQARTAELNAIMTPGSFSSPQFFYSHARHFKRSSD